MYRPDRLSPPLESVGEIEAPVEPWRKALMDAADVIRERGLAQWVRANPEGQVCLHGAIRLAIGASLDGDVHDPRERQAGGAVARYLLASGVDEGLVLNGFGCAQWNDVAGRTAAEVIAALEGAARS